MTDALEQIIRRLKTNRVYAHRVLFRARHKDEDALFHDEMIRDFHDRNIPNLCDIAFRGSAKSTLFEEGVTLRACLKEFQNCIIFGASEDLAIARVHVIKRQLEKNEYLRNIFGDLKGQPWTDGEIELANGVRILAMGRGQAIRGVKGEELRPDFLVFDDIEDRQSVSSPDLREKTMQWFMGEAMPMTDKNALVRMAANDMDPECLANRLKAEGSGWAVKVYPWEFIDEHGLRRPAWPSRFPLHVIDQRREAMTALGRLAEYNKEFMCKSEAPEDKPFKSEMMRVDPAIVRTWQGVYGFFDPARTTKVTSADTGFACWSYIGARLVIWDAWGKKLLPDEILSALFAFNEEFSPAWIGIEEDGLNEFLLQPIRQEQIKRGVYLPLKAMKAPKGKLDFIRGLQPFFHAREVVFAKELPDLKNQLLTFPMGRIDVPNALAYALKMRPGAAVYDDFNAGHVVEDMPVLQGRNVYLCLNATGHITAGALVQAADGTMRVLADWVREGDVATLIPDILREARLEAGRQVRVMGPPQHFERFTNVGLSQACARATMTLERGTTPETGRVEVRRMLKEQVKGFPAFQISSNARWTANGFAGGYARDIGKDGRLADWPQEGPYRTLIEGIESFAGLLKLRSPEEDDNDIAYDYTTMGRRFMTARR